MHLILEVWQNYDVILNCDSVIMSLYMSHTAAIFNVPWLEITSLHQHINPKWWRTSITTVQWVNLQVASENPLCWSPEVQGPTSISDTRSYPNKKAHSSGLKSSSVTLKFDRHLEYHCHGHLSDLEWSWIYEDTHCGLRPCYPHLSEWIGLLLSGKPPVQ